jgi:hypothetical protein
MGIRKVLYSYNQEKAVLNSNVHDLILINIYIHKYNYKK